MTDSRKVGTSGRPIPPEILSRAADVFWRKGYGNTTMRDIATGVGLPISTLYYHIGSKDLLLLELSMEALNQITLDMREEMVTPGWAARPIESLVRVHMKSMLENRHGHALALTELRSLRGPAKEKVLHTRAAYERLVRDIVTDGQSKGVIRSDIPGGTLTLCLLNLLNWTIFWFREDGELSSKLLAKYLSDVFIDGAGSDNNKSERLEPSSETTDKAH